MKKTSLLTFLLIFISLSLASAQGSPAGVWKNIDDETGEAKSHVVIYKKGNDN